jgi:hypothetical protein
VMLDALSINVTTTNEEVNEGREQLWTCHIEFDIPQRWTLIDEHNSVAHTSRPAPSQRSAKGGAVRGILS